MSLRDALDTALELPVFTSFTRLGYDARSRLEHWTDLDSYDLAGRVMLVTGATSGLGLVAARQLAANGATVVVLGRDAAKTSGVRDQLAQQTGNDSVATVVADMGDLAAVRRVADEMVERFDRLDVLVHNAGALSATRQVAPHAATDEPLELTVASQVVGPFLLTSLLMPLLERSGAASPARVITMSSGGMYATGLHIEDLQMGDDYKGSEQYARAKRAQVTLNEMWAARHPGGKVVFHAMHPGWADTPGVRESLPTFRKVVGPLLRTPEQGADTLVWLASDDGEPLATSGNFWLDRKIRDIHKLPTTRRSDTPRQREKLWNWVAASASA